MPLRRSSAVGESIAPALPLGIDIGAMSDARKVTTDKIGLARVLLLLRRIGAFAGLNAPGKGKFL